MEKRGEKEISAFKGDVFIQQVHTQKTLSYCLTGLVSSPICDFVTSHYINMSKKACIAILTQSKIMILKIKNHK